MSKFQLFDAVSLTEPIAQNILFHCGTGVSPVHDLWYWRLARTSSAVKIFIDNKKCDRLIPALGLDFKQG
ncbi:hypothetical protein QT995_14570 [Microcoleus sp. S36b_A3]|uniref:hypothetical protein n=1 Tax=unclassified Microcoleus TaxID=2642155 RepID=UPI002FD5B876